MKQRFFCTSVTQHNYVRAGTTVSVSCMCTWFVQCSATICCGAVHLLWSRPSLTQSNFVYSLVCVLTEALLCKTHPGVDPGRAAVPCSVESSQALACSCIFCLRLVLHVSEVLLFPQFTAGSGLNLMLQPALMPEGFRTFLSRIMGEMSGLH